MSGVEALATRLLRARIRSGSGCRYNESHFTFKTTEPMTESKTWMCLICGWIYDEAAGLPEEGIAPGTPWSQVPVNWVCPECSARKEDFEMVQI